MGQSGKDNPKKFRNNETVKGVSDDALKETQKPSKGFSLSISDFIAVLSVIVAFGAYSKESILYNLLFGERTFSVSATGAFYGPEDISGYYRLSNTLDGLKLAPVDMMIHIEIRNNSDVDQRLRDVRVEIKNGNKWEAVEWLNIMEGIYGTNVEGFEKAMEMDLRDRVLVDLIDKHPIKPKEVISGWLILEVPQYLKTAYHFKRQMRLTLYDGFGIHEEYEIPSVELDIGEKSARAPEFVVSPTIRDLTDIEIVSEKDYRATYKRSSIELSPVPPDSMKNSK